MVCLADRPIPARWFKKGLSMSLRPYCAVPQQIAIVLMTATFTSAALACPTPMDSNSRYHLTERMAAEIAAIRERVMADPVAAPRSRVPAAECVDGFAGQYPCNNIDLAAILPLAEIGGGSGNDIWGWTDPQTGREYAIMGRTNGTAFVDVTVPTSPLYLGNLPSQTGSSLWRDVKVYADHAYIVSEASGHGIQVFDLTQLRDVGNLPAAFSITAHYDGFGAAHNIAINEATGFAYGVGTRNSDDGCGGGLHMVDLADPVNPVFAGCFSADGYTHDVQCVEYHGPDPDWHDDENPKEICFAFNEDTVTIVDVTDKANPTQIARRTYAGSGYTHQGWITDDFAYLLVDDETDEIDFGTNTRTYVWDISNLDNPNILTRYTADTAAIDHNLYVVGDYAFQANYRAGLRILDLSDIASANLVEVGYFDVFPANDAAQFNGAWSVYPYFASGTIVVSGIEQGLVVLEPDALAPPFTVEPAASSLDVCGIAGNDLALAFGAAENYSGTVNLSVSGLPAGASASLQPASVAPPASSTLSVDVSSVVPGIYPVTITADDGDVTVETVIDLKLSATAAAAPQIALPLDGAGGVSSLQDLFWQPADGAQGYDVEVSTSPLFSSLVAESTGIDTTFFAAADAYAAGTQHYWRVYASNACGRTVSTTGSFLTAPEACTVTASTDVPKSIAINATDVVTSVLSTAATGVVLDVDVLNLNGQHTWISDLSMKLAGPTQAGGERVTVQLLTQSCGNEDDFDIVFDDEAPPGPWPCPPADGNAYQPAAPLSSFDRQGGAGEWMLTVTDHFDADGGSLDGWSLRVCTTPAASVPDTDGDGVTDDVDNCRLAANADQRDTDGDGFGNVCDADLNNDGLVNFGDLALLKSQFLATGDLDADFDGDGTVNFGDLALLKSQFLSVPGPAAL